MISIFPHTQNKVTMKKLLAFLLLAAGLAWAACNKDAVADYQQLDDETLARAIAADGAKETVNPNDLPAAILRSLADEDFDTYVESAAFAREKGYEITFATDEQAYFNLAGERLRHRPLRDHGRCGALGGEPIAPADLRPAILDYIAAHYPGAEILRAKHRGDHVIVLLSGHILLVFSPDGVFEANDQQWHDCRACADPSQVSLPDDVVALIETEFPGAEIKRVCRRGDRIVIGVLAADGRHILVFDSDWNFLFSQP